MAILKILGLGVGTTPKSEVPGGGVGVKNLTPPKNHFSRRFGPWRVRICKNLEIEILWVRSRQKWLCRRSLQGKNIFFRFQPCQLYRNDPQHSLIIFDFFGENFFGAPRAAKNGQNGKNGPFFAQKLFFSTFWTMRSPNMQKKISKNLQNQRGDPLVLGAKSEGSPFGFWPKKIFSIFFHGNFFFHGGYFGHRPTSNP